MRYRVVVVENEEHSLARMKRLLDQFPEQVEVIGDAVDGPSAVDVIRRLVPDVIFLDIDLPGLNGFEVLAKLDRQPIVIFTTAHNQHALDAFRTHAVDYLLKPIDVKAVSRSLQKLASMVVSPAHVSDMLARLRELDSARSLDRIACRNGDSTVLVKLGEITYFQSDNKYTSVFTLNREFLIDASLIDLERRLNPKDFVRIHRSTLVNVSWIAEIKRGFDGRTTVLLRDLKDKELPVGRTYVDVLRRLGQLEKEPS
jgi:two-component system LytT family response regulator